MFDKSITTQNQNRSRVRDIKLRSLYQKFLPIVAALMLMSIQKFKLNMDKQVLK